MLFQDFLLLMQQRQSVSLLLFYLYRLVSMHGVGRLLAWQLLPEISFDNPLFSNNQFAGGVSLLK